MENLFLEILNMSITASYLALCVILLRFCLKKTPKWIMGVLWGFVGFRLICPVSFESIFSLIPSAKTIPEDILVSNSPAIYSGIPAVNSTVNQLISQSYAPSAAESANPMQIITLAAAIIWLVGVFAMLAYMLISTLKIKRNLREAALFKDNIFLCDAIETPFILGVFKPKIYLPSDIKANEIEYVTAHENAHIQRHDNLWKPLGFLLLSVYWFNPVLWLAYICLCKDIELACDEKVIKQLGEEAKKPYSEALINCSVQRKIISACPLAFGETGTKERIKNVLKYKKPAFWTVIIGIILLIAIAVCLMTNPKGVYLKNIEDYKLENAVESTVSVIWSNGEDFEAIPAFAKKQLSALLNIRINPTAISESRSEDRDKSQTLVLQNSKNIEATTEKITGFFIHFNDDFSEVWVNDGVKPTLTYEVVKPKKAERVFGNIRNMVGADTSISAEDELNEIPPIDYADGYGEGALKTAFGNDYEILLKREYSPAETISSQRYAYLVSAKSRTYLVVEDTLQIFFKDVTLEAPAVLGMEMETCDVATNEKLKKNEIILHQCVGLSGGAGSYISRIYKITDDGISEVFTTDGFDSGFTAEFKDGFEMVVKNEYTKSKNTVDLAAAKWYVGKYFNSDGDAISDTSDFMVDKPHTFYAKDVDNDDIFEIISMQYTSLFGHSDYAGTAVSTLKFNKNSNKFEVIDAEFIIDLDEIGKLMPTSSTVIDSVAYDVDNDGIKENCELTVGPFSGRISYYLNITQNGTKEYSSEICDIDIVCFTTENGKLQILAQKTENGKDEQYLVDVIPHNDGTIELKSN